MTSETLQYYMHDGPAAFRFELAGDLNNEGARELAQAWRTASAVIGDRVLIIDMTFVNSAGAEGRTLLARWFAEGAQLIAKSKVSRQLAEAIVGQPLPEVATAGSSGAKRTWLPFHTSFGSLKLGPKLLLAVLLLPLHARAASLKPETVAAWDDYVQSVSIGMQARARSHGSFLWTYEEPERIAKVLNGEVVIGPAPGASPRRVPGGLIHHWIAATFLPNAKLSDILEVIHAYDRYQEFYRPSVIASETLGRDNSNDYFSMLLMNKAFFLKTALDADYQVTNVRLDDRHFYSVSRTTRVQEIEDYQQADERRLPEGEGSGYIWKLFSIVRLEERAEGVYLEMEAIALSRGVPATLRMVVDPIVRHVSRNSIITSIQQTTEAVRSNALSSMKSANSSVNAGRAATMPAVLTNRSPLLATHQ
jgi:hypothetical protein